MWWRKYWSLRTLFWQLLFPQCSRWKFSNREQNNWYLRCSENKNRLCICCFLLCCFSLGLYQMWTWLYLPRKLTLLICKICFSRFCPHNSIIMVSRASCHLFTTVHWTAFQQYFSHCRGLYWLTQPLIGLVYSLFRRHIKMYAFRRE